MADDVRGQAPGLPPQLQLFQMSSYLTPSLLRVAVQLKLADHLADGPRTAEDLAPATETYAPALYRLLRTLSTLGLFVEDDRRRFSLTRLSEPLREGVPGSVREAVLMFTSDYFRRPYANLLYSVQTGRTSFEKEYGEPFFDYISQRPEDAKMFSGLMVGMHVHDAAAVTAAYDFSGVATMADIGGATGQMLTTILAANPGMTGLIVDLPHNEPNAAEYLKAHGMTERAKFEAGNFFESVPAGYDVYVMAQVIHDWSEEQCLTILRNCRRAMRPASRLLIVELIIKEGAGFDPGKMLDMTMLALPGGEERTATEYGHLLAKAGFQMTRVVPTAAEVSVVEAFAA